MPFRLVGSLQNPEDFDDVRPPGIVGVEIRHCLKVKLLLYAKHFIDRIRGDFILYGC